MRIYKYDIIQRARKRYWSTRGYNRYITPYQDNADEVIEAFLQEIMDAVENGDTVQITGFGTFTPTHRSARLGTDMNTGARIQIAARRAPRFKPGEIFKRRVRG